MLGRDPAATTMVENGAIENGAVEKEAVANKATASGPAETDSTQSESAVTPPANPDAVIRVNVGGVEHATTARTLSQAGPGSPLSKLLPAASGSPAPFIDRDGALFTQVLRFLRGGSLPACRSTRAALTAEARALHIPALLKALEERERRDARVGVLVFERVTTLVDGNAVSGHFSVAGRVESPSRWVFGFSPQALVSQFQTRVEKEVQEYTARTGLTLLSSSTTASLAPLDFTPPTDAKRAPQRLVHVHTLTCTFGSPDAAKH